MNKDEFVEKYRKIINNLKLKGCDNVLCGDVCYYTLWMLYPNKLTFINLIKVIFRIIFRTFFINYEFKINGNQPDAFCLFSSSYGEREDLKRNYMKAVNLIPNRLDMIYSNKKKFLGFCYVKHLFKILNWNKQLRKDIPDVYLRFLIIKTIYGSFLDYELYKDFTKKNKLNITKLVSNCDTHAVDSFFTQKFNSNNYLTVTLQHGAVGSSYNRWALEGIKSKHFICHNEFTVDEAKLTSFNKNIIPAGVLSNIGEPNILVPSSFAKKNIGIFLDGEILREDNLVIIDFLSKYFKNSDYKLFFKFHPSSKIESYKEFLPRDSECYGKEISIMDFANKIDIAILSSSTVLIELLQVWKPVFIIHTNKQKYDLFKNSKSLRFANREELTKLLDSVGSEEFIHRLKQMRDYFCCNGDIAENYIKAFKEIGII